MDWVYNFERKVKMGSKKINIQKFFEKESIVEQFKTQKDYNLFSRRRVVYDMLKKTDFKRIVDLGCGSGGYLDILKKYDCRYYGLDFSRNMIETAKDEAKKLGVSKRAFFEQGDADNTPYEDCFFDAILAICLIEYFENPDKFIKEIKRISMRNCTLIMQSFYFNPCIYLLNSILVAIKNFIIGKDEKVKHNQYCKKDLDNLMARNGFQLVDFAFSNFHILPEPFSKFFPGIHAYFSESLAQKNPKGFSFFAANYIGKYRLINK